ncbi:MAG: hypothetical protein WKF33_04500 [Thermoleophilaceae bacterium]
MAFALYEYDAAYRLFFGETVRTIAQARSPLLAQMQFIEISGTVGSRVRTREGMDVSLESGEISTEVSNDLTAIRAGDYEQLYVELDQAADAMAEELVGHFVQTMDKVTEGTGNVVDAGGQKLSFDLIYEALDRIELSVDEDGQLVMPSFLMHPDQAEKLRELEPLTPEQEAKLADLKERKREEALARRRRRRLS